METKTWNAKFSLRPISVERLYPGHLHADTSTGSRNPSTGETPSELSGAGPVSVL